MTSVTPLALPRTLLLLPKLACMRQHQRQPSRGSRFLPLLHNADNPWMRPAALVFLHDLCHQAALRSALDCPSWGAHFTLQRHSAAASVGHALALPAADIQVVTCFPDSLLGLCFLDSAAALG